MPKRNMRDLSFATFNLLNLQVPGGITYSNTPDLADDAEGRAIYQRKLEWIGRQIAELDVEVIAFQELWSRQALVSAFEQSGLLQDYDLVARDAPGRGRPQVALAVKKNRKGKPQLMPGSQWCESFPEDFQFEDLHERDGACEEITVTINKFSRPVLMACVQSEGTRPKPPPIKIFVAHLKSKGPARLSFQGENLALDNYPSITLSAVSHIRRVMEAGALRAILDKQMRSADDSELSPTVVIGDLNDGTLSVTNELLSAQPTYRVIEKSRAGRRSDKGLYSVERLQQYRSLRHTYYTHVFKGKRESLDHILVSEEFYDHSRKRQWSFREMNVVNDHLSRDTKTERAQIGASDHGLVKACFDWNPMPSEIDVAKAS